LGHIGREGRRQRLLQAAVIHAQRREDMAPDGLRVRLARDPLYDVTSHGVHGPRIQYRRFRRVESDGRPMLHEAYTFRCEAGRDFLDP
jgi:hypothetical protein